MQYNNNLYVNNLKYLQASDHSLAYSCFEYGVRHDWLKNSKS